MAAQAGEDGFPDDQHYTEGLKPKEPENKVGSVNFHFRFNRILRATLRYSYQYKNKRFVIEGTRAITGGDDEDEQQKRSGTAQLHEDHFACICACLMLLSHPVEKWDTKKVDEVSHIYLNNSCGFTECGFRFWIMETTFLPMLMTWKCPRNVQ